MAPATEARHWRALDGLRGIAVICVVVFHLGWFFKAGSLVPGAVVGVDLFFALSGFLITDLLLAEHARSGRIWLTGFWCRRGLRLLPALGPFLGVYVAIAVIEGDPLGHIVRWVAAVALYVANIGWVVENDMPNPIAQTWSLAVEEQFYVVWPIVVAVLLRHRNGLRLLGVLAAAGALASLLFRVVLYASGHQVAAYALLPARADGILIGCALAVLRRSGWRPARPCAVATGGAALFAVIVAASHHDRSELYFGGYTLAAIASAGMIVGVVEGGWRGAKVLQWRPLVVAGRVSYGIYLWSVVATYAASRVLSAPAVVEVAASLVLTAAATYASWRFVEKPFLRRKERWSSQPVGEMHERIVPSSSRGLAPVASS